MSDESEWRANNCAHWDEKVGIHLGQRGYDLTALREGRGRFYPIEKAELGPVAGKRVLHLQCHFGSDALKFAQRGANAVGLDFSADAIAAARRLAGELGLADRADFVLTDIYNAPAALEEPAASISCSSAGARFAGYPTSTDGPRSSPISSGQTGFCTSPRRIRRPWYSTTQRVRPTVGPAFTCLIWRARHW